MQTFYSENEFDLRENDYTDKIHFHNNCLTQRLVLPHRERATGKCGLFAGSHLKPTDQPPPRQDFSQVSVVITACLVIYSALN